MEKLFISQPMKGKTNEQILKERNDLINEAKSILGTDEIEVVDSFFADAPKDENNVVTEPIWYLGKSIQKLSEATCAVFGDWWNRYNGCCVEHDICKRYDIKILRD